MLPGAAGTAAGGLPYGFTADFSQATSYGLGLGGAGGLDELGGGAAGVAGAGGVGVGVDGALPGFSSQADGFLLSQGFNETQFLDAATGEYYGAFGGAATQVGASGGHLAAANRCCQGWGRWHACWARPVHGRTWRTFHGISGHL